MTLCVSTKASEEPYGQGQKRGEAGRASYGSCLRLRPATRNSLVSLSWGHVVRYLVKDLSPVRSRARGVMREYFSGRRCLFEHS